MNKKNIFLSAFALIPAFALSALPEFSMSAGGGVMLGGLFTSYTITANDANTPNNKLKMTQKAQQFDFGGFGFFDATYGELSVVIQHGINAYEDQERVGNVRKGTGSETILAFTLLGKYPFKFKDVFRAYPLAGIEYQIALSEKRNDEVRGEHDRTTGITEFPGADLTLSSWNSWIVKIGGGLDFYFNSPWYIKSEFLYSFRLMTSYEKASIDYLKKAYGISQPKLFADPGMKGLTHGPELRVALGYRLK